MKRINLLKPEKLVTLLHWIGWPVGLAYIMSMVAIPAIRSGFNWDRIQEIWDRWQTLNAGMLALIASVIAFQIAQYKEKKQSGREFLAARAFLPGALSELDGYLKNCAAVHMARWNNTPLTALPEVPVQYREVFENCIRHAEDEAGERLAEILKWLQVHEARLEDFIAKPAHNVGLNQHEALRGLRLDGELLARVHRLFDFARGMKKLNSGPLTWEEFNAAYLNLGLFIDTLAVGKVSLESMTKRRLANQDVAEAP